MKTMAVVVSMPGRPLEQTLQSLAGHVDALVAVLNGYPSVPEYVRELCTDVIQFPENRGSSAKLHLADLWDGYYFCCDDDLWYPPDYIPTMVAELNRWGGEAIVTACGRTLAMEARTWFASVGERRYIAEVNPARWINYLGGCAFGFHTRLEVPTSVSPMNEEESQLSVWAQKTLTPIRLVARPYDWPKRIALPAGTPTLYEAAHAERFATRSRIIASWDNWRVHQLSLPVNV